MRSTTRRKGVRFRFRWGVACLSVENKRLDREGVANLLNGCGYVLRTTKRTTTTRCGPCFATYQMWVLVCEPIYCETTGAIRPVRGFGREFQVGLPFRSGSFHAECPTPRSQEFPEMAVVAQNRSTGSHFGWKLGEFTTHFRTNFSGWIGMFTGGMGF